MALKSHSEVHLGELPPIQPVEGTVSLRKIQRVESQEEPHAAEMGRIRCCGTKQQSEEEKVNVTDP